MQVWFMTALAGAATGAAMAVVGYLGVAKNEPFDVSKAIPTLIVGTIAGTMAGVLTSDVKAAIIAAQSGELLKRAIINFNQK